MLILTGYAELQIRRHGFHGAERLNKGLLLGGINIRLRDFQVQDIDERVKRGLSCATEDSVHQKQSDKKASSHGV